MDRHQANEPGLHEENARLRQRIVELEAALDNAQQLLLPVVETTNRTPLHDAMGRTIAIPSVSEDMSQQEQAAETPRLNGGQCCTLIESMPVAVYILQGDTFLYVNPAGEGLTGYTREALLTKHYLDIIHPDSHHQFRQLATTLIGGDNTTTRDEVRLITSAGTERWVDMMVSPIEFEGKPAMLVTGSDTTERKQLEQQWYEEAMSFRTIAETTPLPLAFTRISDGLILYANSHFERTFERPGGVTGQVSPDYYVNRADRKAIMDKLRREGTVANYEVQLKKDDGTPVWTLMSISPVTFRGEETVIGYVVDITERKRQEEALRTSQERFRAIFDRAPVGIEIGNRHGLIIDSNPAFQRMLGYSHEELTHLTFADLSHPDDRAASIAAYERMITGQTDHYVIEKRYVHKAGHTIWVQVTASIVRNDAGEPLYAMGVIQDISEQKRVAEERQMVQQQIIEAQRAAIRELSTPLIPIAAHVVVMPLIGSIDSLRAQAVLETLLQGVAMHQAEVVILDMTGLQVVDTQIAQALVQAAQAVKLLGARVLLTGIQPQTAQTLVHLGVDLSGIITRSDLQSGIAYALALTGRVSHA